VNELTKLSLTKDSFIYTTNQAYEARIQNDGSFNSHLKYEPFLEKTWLLPQNYDLNSFKKTLGEIIEHHFEKLPNYKRDETVNIENIAWFSHSIAALFADIEFLVMAYTGHALPLLPTSQIPRTNTSKNISLAIKKYVDFKNHVTNGEKFSLFPLTEEDNTNADELYTQELWSLIFYLIRKVFGSYTDVISLYATWKYVAKSSVVEAIDWNTRPPCGSAYRKEFKHLFVKDYQKNGFKKNTDSSKNDFKTPQSAAVLNEKSSNELPIKPFPEYKPKSNEYKPKFNEYKEKTNRPEKDFQKNQDELIDKAVLEASLAVEKMKKNGHVKEIALSPQNSFIRRQQHVVISEGGFETESRGEEESRYVCVKRK
jgi:hypothetical protein